MKRSTAIMLIAGIAALCFRTGMSGETAGEPPGDVKLSTVTVRTVSHGRDTVSTRAVITAAPRLLNEKGEEVRPVVRALKGDARYTREVANGIYALRYREKTPSAGFTFIRNDASVRFVPLGATAGLATDVETTAAGVKETVWLDSAAGNPLRWLMETGAEIEQRGNEVRFVDASGALLFRIPPPVAWDADGRTVGVTVTVSGDTLIYRCDLPEDVRWPVAVDPTVTVGEFSTGTGYTRSWNADYTTSRAATEGDAGTHLVTVGQKYDGGNYFIYRGHLLFDTSALPEDAIIDSARISLELINKPHDCDYGLMIANGYAVGDTLYTGWHDEFPGWRSIGRFSSLQAASDSLSSTAYSEGDTLHFQLTPTGLSHILRDGTTRYMAFSTDDINYLPPEGPLWEYMEFDDESAALTVWYRRPKRPWDFVMTALDSTSIACEWTDNNDMETAHYIIDLADSTVVDSLGADVESHTVAGLEPATFHRWAVASDSSGVLLYSNPDSAWTGPASPGEMRFTAYRSAGAGLWFDGGANPDSTAFAVRIITGADSLYWNGDAADTTSAPYLKTRPAWGDTIPLYNPSVFAAATSHAVIVEARNGAGAAVPVRGDFTTSDPPATLTLTTAEPGVRVRGLYTVPGITSHPAARSVESPDSILAESAVPRIGQRFTGTYYTVMRTGFEAALPEGYAAHAGSLHVYAGEDSTSADFTIAAFAGEWTADGLTDDAFRLFDGRRPWDTPHTGTNLFGSWSTAGLSGAADWVFNGDGLDTLSGALGDTLRLTVVSSRDVSADQPSGMEFFGVDADSVRLTLAVDLPDSLPGEVALAAISPDSLLVSWLDRSRSETGYLVVNTVGGTAVSDTLGAGTEQARIGGLGTNTLHSWRIAVVGGNLDGVLSAADSAFTDANVPGKPSLVTGGGLPGTLLKFVIDPNGNPAYTEFAVQDSLSGRYVDPTAHPDTLAASTGEWMWRTFGDWGGAAGDTLAVTPDTVYRLRVKARSGGAE